MKWEPALSVGIEVIDSQHRRFDGDRAEVRAASVDHALRGLLQRAQLTP